MNVPHMRQSVGAPPEPLLTELTLVSLYLEVHFFDVYVQASELDVAVGTYSATVAVV